MNKLILFSFFFTLGSIFSFGQKEEQMTFIIESLDGNDRTEIHYPIGTTFYVDVLNKLEDTKRRSNSVTYTGDLDLIIRPSYNRDKKELKNIRAERLTVIYYEEIPASLKDEVMTDSVLENKSLATAPETFWQRKPQVNVYPNPVSSKLNIKLNGIVMGSGKIQFFNVNGALVSEILGTNLDNTTEMDLSGFTPGTYFLVINPENGAAIKQKVIVTNP